MLLVEKGEPSLCCIYVVVSSLFKLVGILDQSTICKKWNVIIIALYIDSCPWYFFKGVVLTRQTITY